MVTQRTSVLQIADGKETWNSETETPHCSAAWGHMGEQRAEELLDEGTVYRILKEFYSI